MVLHVRRDSILHPEMFTGELSILSQESGSLAVPVAPEVAPSRVACAISPLDEKLAKARALLKRRGSIFMGNFSAGLLPPRFDSNSIPSTMVLAPAGR